MSKYIHATVGAAVLALGMAGLTIPGAAAPFYKDRTVTVVVPSGSGGTYHVYCQIFARHIGRHIPGNPKVITQNRPGAGGAKAARYMVTAAPKDGSYMAMINPGSTMLPLLRPGIGFETRKMQWLGTMAARTYTIGVWHTVPVNTIADAKKHKITMGTSGKASTGYQVPAFMNATIGTKFKVILGYKSGGATNLAIERGEVEGRGNFYSGYTGVRPHWLKQNLIKFLVTLGPKRAEVENIPQLRDMMETKLQREMLDLLEVNFYIGQSFYLPPGVPRARVDVVRKAFSAMMKDPVMLADAKKRRVPITPRTHQQVEKVLAIGFEARPEAVEGLRKILGFDKKRKKKKG